MTGDDARDQVRDEVLPDRPCETSDLFRDYVGDGREYRGHNGECENCGEKFKESDHGDLGDAHWLHTLAIARACWERDTGPEVQALALAMDPEDPLDATEHATELLASSWFAGYVATKQAEALRDRESFTIHIAEMGFGGKPSASVVPGPVWDVAERVMAKNHTDGRIVSRTTPIDDRYRPVELVCEGTVTLDGEDHLWTHRFLRPSDPWVREPADPIAKAGA